MYTRALLTDLYELTMAAAYLEQGKAADTATFDLYYPAQSFQRRLRHRRGLEDAVRAVMDVKFSDDDIRFLRSLKSSTGAPIVSR